MNNDRVNKMAADKFLGTMDMKMAKVEQIMNAKQDAISYGLWNKATLDYIIRGIERAYVYGKV